MSTLIAIAFWLVALGHLAVLLDRGIVEPNAFERVRRVRLAAWVVVGLVSWQGVGVWVMPVLALAMCDAISAIGRLWPETHEGPVSGLVK